MEAALYTRRDDLSVSCSLCSHRCVVAAGRRGVCGVRENRDGTLYTLVYGSLVARAVDPIEKKPLYHFLPGTSSFSIATVGCNFRCEFCQNWQISQPRPGAQRGVVEASPDEVARDALGSGCASIAYTYTEPTIFFEFARDTGRRAREKGLANVFVTNGYQTPETIDEMAGFVDAANVDLKSFSDAFYRERCGARLQPVLDAIARMHECGIHVEVTTLVIPGWNDGEDELGRIASFIAGLSVDMPWHVSRFHPDYKATDREWTPDSTMDVALAAGAAAGLKYVYAGNVARGEANTACPSCGAMLVRRRGYRTEVVGLSGGTMRERGVLAGARCKACGSDVALVILPSRQ
jgi:pyruvate formate lyase activating enzyme